MKVGSKLLILMVALAMLVSALSGAFLALAVDPLPYEPSPGGGNGLLPRAPDNQTAPGFEAGLDLERQPESGEVLFRVIDNRGLSYLRCAVFDNYEDGMWTSTGSSLEPYDGSGVEVQRPQNADWQQRSITIEPMKDFNEAVPAAKDATALRPSSPLLMEYDQGAQTFKFLERTRQHYLVEYYSTTYSLLTLKSAGVVREARYLQVPEGLTDRLESMAHFVVGNLTAPYDQVMALQEFIKSSYIYSQHYPLAPRGSDPVETFLFTSKLGVCGHFNTALVLMCRSIGIPARMVGGYHISPYAELINVDGSMAHSYAEVRFEGQGWMIFDATPTTPSSPEQVKDDVPKPEAEKKGDIWGHVFEDINMNGARDRGEPGMGQASLYLEDRPGNITMRSTTSWQGVYLFKNISYGQYALGLVLDEGWRNSSPLRVPVTVGDNMGISAIDFSEFFDSALINGTIPTITNITESHFSALKGRNFTVEGRVLDYQGHNVNDMQVRIYLAVSKTANRSLCGMGQVVKGRFNVTCIIPQNLPPGDYQLIAHALSSFVYHGSDSDPVIRVMDGTHLEFTGFEKVVEGGVSIIRVALLYNSTGEVVVGAVLKATGYKQVTLISGKYSYDRLLIRTEGPGNYSVHIAYAGDDLLLPCSGDFVLHAAEVTVDVDHDDLIRGQDNVVACRMHAEEIPIGGDILIVALSSGQVSNLVTSDGGLFALSVPLPAEQELADLNVTYQLPYGPSFSGSLRVTAATILQTKVLEDYVEARLLDDKGAPLAGQDILVRSLEGNATLRTDGAGKAEVAVGRGVEANFTFIFQGGAHLQPSSVVAHHPASYIVPLDYVLVISLASCLAVSGYYYWRKKPRVRERLTGILPARQTKRRRGPYAVSFPEIPEGLPAVWSQAPLRVKLEGRAKELEVWIDDVPLRTLELDDHRAETEVLLGKGAHQIAVRGPEGSSEREMRIVDYREEMVELYKLGFAKLMSTHKGLTVDMAPREAQNLLKGSIGIERLQDLEVMTSLFERANFSQAPAGRQEYENMYISAGKVCA